MNASVLVYGLKSMRALRRAIDSTEQIETRAMKLGSDVHCLLLEPNVFGDLYVAMPDFASDERNVDAKGNRSWSSRTTWCLHQVQQFQEENAGKEVLSQDELQRLSSISQAFWSHHAGPLLILGAQTEQVYTGEIDGVAVKGRLDAVRPECIVDVKTTADASAFKFGRVSANLKYDFRMGLYRELVRQATGEVLPVKLIAQETGGDYDTVVYDVPAASLDSGLDRVRNVIGQYRKCLETGNWPGIDKGNRSLPLIVPEWTMYERDVEEVFEG